GTVAREAIWRSLSGLPAPGPDGDSVQMAFREVSDVNRRRVVVTGIGVVTAPAQKLDQFWECVRKGISGGTQMTRFPPGGAPTTIAAQINEFDASLFMDAKMARRLDYSHRYGVAAARLAQIDAGIDFEKVEADRG